MDHIACFLLLIFCYLPFNSLVEAKIGGFTVEMIHRDSELSPFYNHSATPEDISSKDFLRSIARAEHFYLSSFDTNKFESTVIINSNNADYLMKISIGSPPLKLLAIADTGSDLIWIQCEPCPQSQCYPQDGPLFNPTKSSTYAELPCESKSCRNLQLRRCGTRNNECQYLYRYGDGSYTIGTLSTDTFTFDSTDGPVATFPNSVLGCGHNNNGKFAPRGSGLVGLGRGPLSLITQLGAQIEQRFSYCLLPRTVNSASKLKFGTDAVISGPGVVSTPMLSDNSGTFYVLTLEGASIGGKKIAYNQMAASEGNIIIDSGTTLTLLEPSFYNDLEAAVRETVGLQTVPDPRGNYKLCYDRNSFSNIHEITVVFQFKGADVALKKLNLFRPISDQLICLTMVPAGSSVFGNYAQMNFQVEYNLANKQVSFLPADCTQF